MEVSVWSHEGVCPFSDGTTTVLVGGVAPQCSFRGGRCPTRRQRRRVLATPCSHPPAPWGVPDSSEMDIVAPEPSFAGGRRSVRVLGGGRCSALLLGGGRRLALLLGCGRRSAPPLGCGRRVGPFGLAQNLLLCYSAILKPKITGLNDYRPVALTSVVMKSFERLVLAYLKNITGPLLDPLQFAYRANSSAFNTIIPTLLQTKLTQLSVPSSICQWITSFLTDRHQLVKLGKFKSNSRTTSTGAPQGCVLSPLLFSLYTNDCTSTDPSIKLLKFADDTTVIGLIQDGDESAYRQEIEQLAAWCSRNNLELNTLKTVEMIVDFRRNSPALPPLTIMNSTVPTVASFRFLGTTISQDLKWDTHIDATIKKAQQRLYFLRQLRKFNLPQELLIHFYSAVIEKFKFKMLTMKLITSQIRSEDWFVTIDLKNAYFHVGIRPEHKKFLRHLCTQLPVRLAYPCPLQGHGSQSLGCGACPYEVSWPQDQPREVCAFSISENHLLGGDLGFHHDVDMSISCSGGVHTGSCKRCLARPEPLCRRGAENPQTHGSSSQCDSFGPASHEAIPVLAQGCGHQSPQASSQCHQGYALWALYPTYVDKTLVSGLGSYSRDVSPSQDSFNGCLTFGLGCGLGPGYFGRPSTLVEMRAVFLSMKHFFPHLRGFHELVRTDSTAVVAYINHQGGLRSSPLFKLVQQILLWAETRLLSLRAIFVPGHINREADCLLRQVLRPGEWRLHTQVVESIWWIYGRAEVDLFASEGSTHCLLWYSLCSGADLAEAAAVCLYAGSSAPTSPSQSVPRWGPPSSSGSLLARSSFGSRTAIS
ncbi:hypothetical protein QTP70_012940 [Hemibagrus guttatus]|uniref:Reverse transcriptase domain-containing protein n=1 Tax=Hemibagrus guttatus TaxID=175788 RepID=A0AAE0QK11_9TELE|nr:hypothetical protein QTP70_012940 [Hemibagrus guttatus]